MSDLGSIDHKIEWAGYHIKELDVQLRWFDRSKPYEIFTQPDPSDPKRVQHMFTNPKPVPNKVPLRIGDAVHNLRAALDHLACLAVEKGSGVITENTAFPVWRKPSVPTPAQYKSLVLGKIKGAPKDVIDLMLGLEPYFGGAEEPIRIVDYLDIVDKHRWPILAFFCARGITLTTTVPGFELSLPPPPDLHKGGPLPPLKDGDVVFNDFADKGKGEIQTNAQPIIEIAFGEPPVLQGEAPLPVLLGLSLFIKETVNKFRAVL